MEPIEQQFEVRFRYAVHFTHDLFASGNSLLRDVLAADGEALPRRAVVVIDSGVTEHHPGLVSNVQQYCREHAAAIALHSAPVILPGGEAVKNDLRWVERIHYLIHQSGICRHSYVIAIGGGALLDVAGYAAATAHRGVRLVRVPTTVLAQNDSGVGVKNGCNAFGKKNFVGTFAPPAAVINDAQFLTTLSDRDWRSGVAEAVKVALVKDAGFFSWLEQSAAALAGRSMAAMEALIYRCARLHLEHIAYNGDPFEMGSARPLDFGHWAAHRLEQLTSYRLRHGEAVAIGVALDSAYSYLAGYLSEREWRRTTELLLACGFALHVPELSQHLGDPGHPRSIFHGLREFREHLGGPLTLTMLAAIGNGFEVHEVNLDLMAESVRLLQRIGGGAGEFEQNMTSLASARHAERILPVIQ